MAEESKPKSRGCLSRIISLFLFAAAVGLAVALYFITQPQEMTDIKGYGDSSAQARDLTVALENAVERGYPLTLSEADLNAWLNQSLTLMQGGALEKQVQLKGVAIRLEKDIAEVILERSVLGQPFTVSMFMRIEQTEAEGGAATTLHRDGGPYHADFPKFKKGGRFGKLVVPQGLLLLVMPSFTKLGEQFSKEIGLGFERMARVSIEDEKLTLDPRERTGQDGVLPGTF